MHGQELARGCLEVPAITSGQAELGTGLTSAPHFTWQVTEETLPRDDGLSMKTVEICHLSQEVLFIDLVRARAKARLDGNVHLQASDGCVGRNSGRHHPQRFEYTSGRTRTGPAPAGRSSGKADGGADISSSKLAAG